MSFHAKWRALGAGALGAALLVSTGCAETALVGQLDDSELQDPDVLPLVGLGISREINDMVYGQYLDLYSIGGHTDETAYGGVSGAESRSAIGDQRGREESGFFEQIHEAVWASYKVVDLAYTLYGNSPEFTSNPIVARAWLNGGMMERVMGDNFCEITYQYGPAGGFNLFSLDGWAATRGFSETYEAGEILGKPAVFERAVFAFDRAIEWADAAIAAGNTVVTEDPEYFDPVQVRTAAYGGKAQAHHALASLGVDPAANWAAATAAAAQVPTDFREEWDTDENLRSNVNWSLSWANDDLSFWAQEINGVQWGSAFTFLVEPGDVRGGVQVCQEFGVTTGTEEEIFTRPNVLNTGNQDCSSPFRSINTDMELRELPRWLLDVHKERFHNVPALEGSDARLIEAEAAIMAGTPNLALFTQKINEVRTFYGASPITQPTSVGELEYPNALDDAMSILDREFLLDDLGEGRRMFHLERWDHPFVRDNFTTHPRWRDLLESQGAGYQRGSCFPLPQRECNTNRAIECPVL